MPDARFIKGLLATASHARRRLSFDEVLEAGLPAVYQQYGERLLYLDGRIFDVSDPEAIAEIMLVGVGAADQAVGLEFGWRHAGACSCRFCATRPTDTAGVVESDAVMTAADEGLTAALPLPQGQRDEALAS